MTPRLMPAPFLLMALLLSSAFVASLGAAFVRHEDSVRNIHQIARRVIADGPLPLIASNCAEQSPPPNKLGTRPDHPPPILRDGWTDGPVVRFVLQSALVFIALHLVSVLWVVRLHQLCGVPRRIGVSGDLAFGAVYWRVTGQSAWLAVPWAVLPMLLWQSAYHLATAEMELRGWMAPAHVDATGVLGVYLGAFLGYLFTVGALTRRVVRRQPGPVPTICAACGYTLAGSPHETCSECGRQATNADRRLFSLKLLGFRLGGDGMRRRYCVLRVLVVVYLLAFPRTMLASSGWMRPDSFWSLIERSDRWAFHFLGLFGLDSDGSEDGDLVEPLPRTQPAT